jgi:hypothetical protein
VCIEVALQGKDSYLHHCYLIYQVAPSVLSSATVCNHREPRAPIHMGSDWPSIATHCAAEKVKREKNGATGEPRLCLT